MKSTAQPQRSLAYVCFQGRMLSAVLVLLSATLIIPSAHTHTFNPIHQFRGPDGNSPGNPLLRDPAGNLYGVTYYGGDLRCNRIQGCGEVFVITKDGVGRELYDFRGGTDGKFPIGGLVRDLAGNLYGATLQGGANDQGSLFNLDRNGVETVVYSFTADDGKPVPQTLVFRSGQLFGATKYGGELVYGSVLNLNVIIGKDTVLYNFTSTEG